MSKRDSLSKDLLSFKVSHTKELIMLFGKYKKDNPQHEGYYESVIMHLNVILESYEMLMGVEHVTH